MAKNVTDAIRKEREIKADEAWIVEKYIVYLWKVKE